MDLLVTMGINAVLETLKDKKQLAKFIDAFAKVYVKIENVAKGNPALTAAIERQRSR